MPNGQLGVGPSIATANNRHAAASTSELTKRLAKQDATISELKAALARQQEETKALLARFKEQERKFRPLTTGSSAPCPCRL